MAPRGRGGRGWAIAGAIVAAVIGLAALAAAFASQTYLADLPPLPTREALWAVRRSPGMTFLDHDGGLIATRGAKYGARVSLAELPPYVGRAILAAEDRRFYAHGAVDIKAIARALTADVRARRSVQGASTLSQQLARTLFLRRDNSLKRKVQEAVLAWRLEQMLGKDAVLELYINRTYFGAGAYGLDAAARTYFGKSARDLTLSEAAVLAGVPNAPSRLALTNDMPAALARQRKILATMQEEGWISAQAHADALAHPPVLAPPPGGEGDYSYILDQAAADATALTGGAAPDLVVRLTIDPSLQATGLQAVRDVVEKQGRPRRVSQGAMVVLAPDGAIRVMVGGLDHQSSAFNRVTQARRQPGSSFKAFVYGAAVERGVRPTDIRQDAPVALGDWNPGNYGGHYSGGMTVQQALARSINTISVRLTQEIGPDAVAEFARRCGLRDIPEHPGPSIALGAYEVTLLQLAAGYQVFQSGGGRTTPYLVEAVQTTRGEVLFAHAASAPLPVYDPLYATRMIGMLKTVITSGTGTHANIGRPAAGKTGTSQNWRDAWFVGFTPDLLAAVWVGNDDNRPMAQVTGGELPAEIWRRFMLVAEKSAPPGDFPWLVTDTAPEAGPIEGGPPPEGGAYEDQPPTGEAPPDMPPGESSDMPPGDDTGPPDAEGGVYRNPDDEDRPPRQGRTYHDPGPPPYRDDSAARYPDRSEAPDSDRPPDDDPPPPEDRRRYRY